MAAAAVATAAGPGAASPQHRTASPPAPYATSRFPTRPPERGPGPRDAAEGGSLLPAAASAAVPGTGQLLQGQLRGVAYLVAEALLAHRYVTGRHEGREARDRYRDLAFTVARAPFAPSVRDTAFQYYEAMSKFVESGPFDLDPGAGIRPPDDAATYNGAQWALAKQIFFANPGTPPSPDTPEYQQALAFYVQRAAGPEFLWSWRDNPAELGRFRDAIDESDAAFRRSSAALGLAVANHLLSAVDAVVSRRLAHRRPGTAIRTVALPAGPGSRWPVLAWTLRVEF